MEQRQSRRNLGFPSGSAAAAPSAWIEGGFYAVTVYATMCEAWGITVRLAGAAGLALMALFCLLHLGRRGAAVHRALVLPLLCGFTYLAVQIVVHGESVMGDFSRPFVTWMLSIVIVQSLMLRPGFAHRFALFAFAMGLMVLPYVQFIDSGPGIARAGLAGNIGIANPNDLSAWLGFCCVFFAIVGIETRRQLVRIVSAVLGTVCLLIIGLTVSRGSLVAVAIGIVIAFRRTLKRGFFPLLVFCLVLWTVYGLGLFDRAIGAYTARGAEESGRLLVWPLAFQRFLSAPAFGVGVSHNATSVPGSGRVITTHNSFLFFAVSSGVLPLALFVAYWVRAAWLAVSSRSDAEPVHDQPFRLPLLVYLLVISMSGDSAYMATWGVVTFSLAMSVPVSRFAQRVRHSRGFQPSRLRTLATQGGYGHLRE